MQTPPIPRDETARLDALKALKILDTPPEERFDRITRLAKRLFRVDIALVSLVDSDRQWFKSRVGLEATETPREISFCGHTIAEGDVMVVSDTHEDDRFADNPLVTDGPKIRFYAGSPISAVDGSRIGTLCIIDRAPRELDREEIGILRDLTVMVERELAALKLATVDELTGLTNRRGLQIMGNHTLALSRRSGQSVTMLFFDLDRFKRINDEFGHAEGDRALVDFAQCLLRAFRDSDVVARIGGDEFCVMTAGSEDSGLRRPLEDLAADLAARNAPRGRDRAVRYSVGVARFDPGAHASVADLISDADKSMYIEKNRGRQPTDSAA